MRRPRSSLPEQVAELILQGERPADIAKALRIEPERLKRLLRSSGYRKALERARERLENSLTNAALRLEGMRSRALDVLSETLDRTDLPRLRFEAAASIFDRAGLPKLSRVQADGAHRPEAFPLSPEALANVQAVFDLRGHGAGTASRDG